MDEDAKGRENNAEKEESADKLGELHDIETKTTEVRKSEMNTLYETEEGNEEIDSVHTDRTDDVAQTSATHTAIDIWRTK